MKLTRFTDFGLRACMRMASEPDRAFSTAELADEFDISRNHLKKVVAALGAAGFIETRRGTGGGAALARPAKEITIGQLVETLEHGSALVECFQADRGNCVITPACRLKGMLASARRKFISELDQYSLADCKLPSRGA